MKIVMKDYNLDHFQEKDVYTFEEIINIIKDLECELHSKEELEDFIEKNGEKIYERYCVIYPENITSDFSIDNIEDIEDFVKTYMEEEI